MYLNIGQQTFCQKLKKMQSTMTALCWQTHLHESLVSIGSEFCQKIKKISSTVPTLYTQAHLHESV